MYNILKQLKNIFTVPTAQAPTRPTPYPKPFPANTVLSNNVTGNGIVPSPTPTHALQNYMPQQVKGASSTSLNKLTKQIQQGFLNYDPHSPAATLAASFARAGQGLPDPYMPAVLALKETSGGKNMTHPNNLLNILYGGNSAYEKPEYGIEGGGGHQGFPGVIKNGYYNDYLKSGNLQDFFKHYTPPTDPRNPSLQGSVDQYNGLRRYFPG